MKKTLLVLGALAAFALLFTGCPKSSGSNTPTSDPSVGGDTVAADKVVWESDSETGTKVTTSGYSSYLDLPAEVDLTGYKYLNVELYVKNAGENNLTAQFMGPKGEDNKKQPLGAITKYNGGIEETATVYQALFGTNTEWTDWDNGGAKVKCDTNVLQAIQVFAQQNAAPYDTVDDVEFYFVKITATNTELK